MLFDMNRFSDASASGAWLLLIAVAATTLGQPAVMAAPSLRGQSLAQAIQAPAPAPAPHQSLTSPSAAVVTPVAAVDLQRYTGLWYEIARIPAWFQSTCWRDTTARYQLGDDGRITVINLSLIHI